MTLPGAAGRGAHTHLPLRGPAPPAALAPSEELPGRRGGAVLIPDRRPARAAQTGRPPGTEPPRRRAQRSAPPGGVRKAESSPHPLPRSAARGASPLQTSSAAGWVLEGPPPSRGQPAGRPEATASFGYRLRGLLPPALFSTGPGGLFQGFPLAMGSLMGKAPGPGAPAHAPLQPTLAAQSQACI